MQFDITHWYRLGEAEKSLNKMIAIDREILCRGPLWNHDRKGPREETSEDEPSIH